jgi:hypothetical protein
LEQGLYTGEVQRLRFMVECAKRQEQDGCVAAGKRVEMLG